MVIQKQDSFKDLGVTFQADLSFKNHIADKINGSGGEVHHPTISGLGIGLGLGGLGGELRVMYY